MMTADTREKQQIALFTNSMAGGGMEKAWVNLARYLLDRGHRVDLLLTRATGPNLGEIPREVRLVELNAGKAFRAIPLLFRLPIHCWGVIPITLADRPQVAKSLPGLVRYLQDERPQALLSTPSGANLAALWAAYLAGSDTRIVIREANSLSSRVSNTKKLFNKMIPGLARRWYPKASKIVTVSNGVKDDLCRVLGGLPPNRIETIYNLIDANEIRRLADEPLDDPWFQDRETPVLLSVGRLKVQKDFPTILQAFANLLKIRAARLVVLGEGPERKRLAALCASLGIDHMVKFPGFVSNPYRYMSRANLFVLSSRWEGLPNVLREALICGCPIVSTDCPSGPAEVLEEGKYGRLVPVGDVPALTKAMLETLKNPPDVGLLKERVDYFSTETALRNYLAAILGEKKSTGF